MSDENTALLVARWREGDQQAATALFDRYFERLIALARSRLSANLATRFDPEDVVQSAYRSFFNGTKDGRYEVKRGVDLWHLLVVITIHKLQRQVRHNNSEKRAVRREERLNDQNYPESLNDGRLAQEPSPVEAVALVDELEQLMRKLNPLERRMLELRLQGFSLEEIVADTQRSLATVRRTLKRVKDDLDLRYREQYEG